MQHVLEHIAEYDLLAVRPQGEGIWRDLTGVVAALFDRCASTTPPNSSCSA